MRAVHANSSWIIYELPVRGQKRKQKALRAKAILCSHAAVKSKQKDFLNRNSKFQWGESTTIRKRRKQTNRQMQSGDSKTNRQTSRHGLS